MAPRLIVAVLLSAVGAAVRRCVRSCLVADVVLVLTSMSVLVVLVCHTELDQTPWLPKERQDQVRASHAEPSKPRDINPWAMRNDPLRQKAEARMAGMGDINTAGRVVRGKRKAELMGK